MNELSATDLATLLNAEPTTQVLDVREPWERDIASLADSIHIPMGQIPARVQELDPDKHWVCLCHHGIRSRHVAIYLQHQGFATVDNLQGGIDAWSSHVDHTCPVY